MRIWYWISDVCSSDLFQVLQYFKHPARACPREFRSQNTRRFVLYRRHMLGAHGASVESCLHVHDGNARYVVPCPYRALNRRRAAPAGKKGGMDIQTTLSRGSQNGLGEDQAISGDYGHVGLRSEEHTSELQSLMRTTYAV